MFRAMIHQWSSAVVSKLKQFTCIKLYVNVKGFSYPSKVGKHLREEIKYNANTSGTLYIRCLLERNMEIEKQSPIKTWIMLNKINDLNVRACTFLARLTLSTKVLINHAGNRINLAKNDIILLGFSKRVHLLLFNACSFNVILLALKFLVEKGWIHWNFINLIF